MISNNTKKAWKSAIDLLSRRNHSVAEIRSKLKQRGFGHTEIEAVINACQKDHYIDDEATADMWIRTFFRKGFGPFRIHQELKRKGLLPEAFDDYLKRNPDAPAPDEIACLALLRKKNTFLREKDHQKRQQKMYRFLYNRGFPGDVISRAIQTTDLTFTD